MAFSVKVKGYKLLIFECSYSLPDKVFGLRYQSPPFNNVLFVRLTQGGSFYPCQKHYLKSYKGK